MKRDGFFLVDVLGRIDGNDAREMDVVVVIGDGGLIVAGDVEMVDVGVCDGAGNVTDGCGSGRGIGIDEVLRWGRGWWHWAWL